MAGSVTLRSRIDGRFERQDWAESSEKLTCSTCAQPSLNRVKARASEIWAWMWLPVDALRLAIGLFAAVRRMFLRPKASASLCKDSSSPY